MIILRIVMAQEDCIYIEKFIFLCYNDKKCLELVIWKTKYIVCRLKPLTELLN